MEAWHAEVRKADWENSANVKRHYATASILSADRIVFNINGNDYRLIVAVDFQKSIVWINGSERTSSTTKLTHGVSNMKELKPIKTEADYEAGLTEIGRLWGARSGTPAGDRLDVLATLVEVYEQEHFPLDPPDPIEAIKFRMEQQGLTRKDLESIFGTRTRVAEILNRRRGLSINMIRKLHEELGISTDVLLKPTRRRRAA